MGEGKVRKGMRERVKGRQRRGEGDTNEEMRERGKGRRVSHGGGSMRRGGREGGGCITLTQTPVAAVCEGYR